MTVYAVTESMEQPMNVLFLRPSARRVSSSEAFAGTMEFGSSMISGIERRMHIKDFEFETPCLVGTTVLPVISGEPQWFRGCGVFGERSHSLPLPSTTTRRGCPGSRWGTDHEGFSERLAFGAHPNSGTSCQNPVGEGYVNQLEANTYT